MCGHLNGERWSVMKEELKEEKKDVVSLVAKLLFQQDCMALQLERVWKLNLKLPPLTLTTDFLHGLKTCLGEVGTASTTLIMLVCEGSLYTKIRGAAFVYAYIAIYSNKNK